ncbi:MAG: hypothetical protein H8D67_32470 [Deltaproteobacteria bacterium]|nr:hypothetical protein [Deltaproteobacteria bacterium]
MLFGKNKEITYSPGRLAKRLGISRMSLMNHLRAANLMPRCYQDENGWWRIPYSVAIEIAGPEALTVDMPKKKPRGVHADKRKSSKKEVEQWDEYVADLMEENKPQRRPPMSSRERMREEAIKRVDEEFQSDQRHAEQMMKAGITPQIMAQWLQKNQAPVQQTG